MERQFDVLREANYLEGTKPREFAEKAAELINEINAGHPFIEGNGRIQRVFLDLVAERAGYTIEIRPEDRDAWNEAARIGFLAMSIEPMAPPHRKSPGAPHGKIRRQDERARHRTIEKQIETQIDRTQSGPTVEGMRESIRQQDAEEPHPAGTTSCPAISTPRSPP